MEPFKVQMKLIFDPSDKMKIFPPLLRSKFFFSFCVGSFVLGLTQSLLSSSFPRPTAAAVEVALLCFAWLCRC